MEISRRFKGIWHVSSLRSLGCGADLDNRVLSLDVLTEKTQGIVCAFLSSELARVTVCGSQADSLTVWARTDVHQHGPPRAEPCPSASRRVP